MATDAPGRFVIIGNGIAGTLAAETIRRQAPQARVTVLAGEPYPLYNRVALPRLLRGEIPEARVFMRTEDQHVRLGYELFCATWVERVDTTARLVHTSDGAIRPYDRLLVATGGHPRRLEAPGAESDPAGLVYFQTLDDTRRIAALLADARAAVVVGGSYIAYELAEGFRRRGLAVTWLIRGPHFLRRILDPEGGALVDSIARRSGVEVVYGEEVARVVVVRGAVRAVVTTGGRRLDAGVVGCGLGLVPNAGFLERSGVEVGHGVRTNEFLETSAPGVYAAGDVAEFFDPFLGRHHSMGTWDNASTQGRLAAANMLGERQPYEDVPSYTSTLFDSTLHVLGMTTEDDPDLESVSRVDMQAGKYRRLFFRGDRLVGAVMIGDREGRRPLKQMIRERWTVRAGERESLLRVR